MDTPIEIYVMLSLPCPHLLNKHVILKIVYPTDGTETAMLHQLLSGASR